MQPVLSRLVDGVFQGGGDASRLAVECVEELRAGRRKMTQALTILRELLEPHRQSYKSHEVHAIVHAGMATRLGIDPVPCPGDLLRHVSLGRILRLHADLPNGDVDWLPVGPRTLAYLRDELECGPDSPREPSPSRTRDFTDVESSRESVLDSRPSKRRSKRKFKMVRTSSSSSRASRGEEICVPGTPVRSTQTRRTPRLSDVVPETP
jgi:hypothetical protein